MGMNYITFRSVTLAQRGERILRSVELLRGSAVVFGKVYAQKEDGSVEELAV